MRKLSILGVFAALLMGCTSATPKAAKHEPETEKTSAKGNADRATTEGDEAGAEDAASDDADARKVGDFVSFAFSGSFAKTPFVLTQRVTDRARGKIAVLFEIAEGGKVRERLLVETSTQRADRGKVLSVARVDEAGKTTEATAETFEALLAKTVPSTDQNDGLLASEPTTLNVGDTQVAATKFEYAVRVGGKKAKMSAYASEAFAWGGDLGGEVKAENGKVLYKAEIVDMGSAKRETALLAP